MAILESYFDGKKYKISFNENTGELKLYRHDELWDSFPKYSKMLISILYEIFDYEEKLKKTTDALEKLSQFGEGTSGARKMSTWDCLEELQIEMEERMNFVKETLENLRTEL